MPKPPAPPAPPNASQLRGIDLKKFGPLPGTVTIPYVPPPTTEERLLTLAKEIERVARLIPTPNVTDSQLHAAALMHVAVQLRELAD